MHELTALIRKDMVPALGVTEPGAIAFCVAKTRSLIGGEPIHLNVAMNGGRIISESELRTAQLLCNAAIEARVIGLDRPAMSITGSGAHGINGFTPEDTMHNMGRIASPGMTMTEKTIVEIQQEKLQA